MVGGVSTERDGRGGEDEDDVSKEVSSGRGRQSGRVGWGGVAVTGMFFKFDKVRHD